VLNLEIMNSLSIYFGMIGGMQIAIIVVVVLLFFGGKKIPELMKGLGSGIKEFKNAAKEDSEEKIEEKK
jgi:sec-independent protein translocase protein TatA